jgi:hypothetical protein
MFNRSYAIFRESMKRLPTLDTIYEEVYEEEIGPIEPEPCELMWGHWQSARDDEWGQWIDVEYMDIICS